MNIDERLDRISQIIQRITERHEGLSLSVELLVSTHKDHENSFEEHRREQEEHRREQEEHRREQERRFEEHRRLVSGAIEVLVENDRKLTQMLAGMREEQKQDRSEFRDAIMRLSVIAEAHQDRLDDHEGRLRDNRK